MCSPAARLAAEEGFSDWVTLAAFLASEKEKVTGKNEAKAADGCDWAAYVEALPEKTGGVVEWPETQVYRYREAR